MQQHPRCGVLGVKLLAVTGEVLRFGGRVMKNVAGYDLMRLMAGSWGSLGLISSLTLRTMPEPPQRRGLKLEGPLEALGQLASWLLGSSLFSAQLAAERGLPYAFASHFAPRFLLQALELIQVFDLLLFLFLRIPVNLRRRQTDTRTRCTL